MTTHISIIKRIRRGITENLSNREIARRLGLSHTTVSKFRRAPDHALRAMKRSARRSVLDRRERIHTLVEARGGPETGYARRYPTRADIRKALPRRFQNTSLSTITNDLLALGYVSKVRPKVVNNDPVKNAFRLAFCSRIQRLVNFRHIDFSDEAYFTNNDNTHRREFVAAKLRKGRTSKAARRAHLAATKYPSPRVHMRQTNVKVMVWGCIGWNFKSELVILDRCMTADDYQRLVLPHYLPQARGRIFMQDNARPHTAKSTLAFLRENGVRVLDGWPPYSPHLNPIERVWALMHRRVAQLRPKTKDALIRAVRKVWRELPQKTINNYVTGFGDGVERSIRNGGSPW